MSVKWYKYEDKCPGCGSPIRRRDTHMYLGCDTCGFVVGVPSYREADVPAAFLKHAVGGVQTEMTIVHFAKIQRLVVEQVERLPAPVRVES